MGHGFVLDTVDVELVRFEVIKLKCSKFKAEMECSAIKFLHRT